MNYKDFIETKRNSKIPSVMVPGQLNAKLFDFQAHLVEWLK